jgi:hypothetical protein
MEITQQKREQLLRGIEASASASGSARWCPDARSAPKWAADRIVEIRAAILDGRPVPPPSRDYVQAAEMRTQIAAFNRTHSPVILPRRRPTGTLSDAQLRAEFDRIGEQIRVDALKDPSLRAVKFVNGRWERDFEKEKELDLVALRKKNTEDDQDLDDDSDWSSERHARVAAKHRFVAQHSSLDDACKHYACADGHQAAADKFSRETSRKARKASRLAFPESVIS